MSYHVLGLPRISILKSSPLPARLAGQSVHQLPKQRQPEAEGTVLRSFRVSSSTPAPSQETSPRDSKYLLRMAFKGKKGLRTS